VKPDLQGTEAQARWVASGPTLDDMATLCTRNVRALSRGGPWRVGLVTPALSASSCVHSCSQTVVRGSIGTTVMGRASNLGRVAGYMK
jgi:hypothetical protein